MIYYELWVEFYVTDPIIRYFRNFFGLFRLLWAPYLNLRVQHTEA